MIHFVESQVDSKDIFRLPLRERITGRLVEVEPKNSRITRRTNEGKDKMNGDKGAALKGPAVTPPIMSMRRKDKGI